MVSAINRHLPDDVQFDAPQGGLFIWVRLPNSLSADDLLPMACKEGVDFVPGSRFFPNNSGGKSWMRLNFVVQEPKKIEEGIKRLGVAIRALTS